MKVRGLRSKWEDLLKKAPAPTITVQGTEPNKEDTVNMTSSMDDFKCSDVLDSTMTGSFKLRPGEELARLRAHHRTTTGDDPPSNERPSSEQLSALTHRLDTRGTIYVDLSVWMPFGLAI